MATPRTMIDWIRGNESIRLTYTSDGRRPLKLLLKFARAEAESSGLLDRITEKEYQDGIHITKELM